MEGVSEVEESDHFEDKNIVSEKYSQVPIYRTNQQLGTNFL